MTAPRILYCHCAYSQVVPHEVKHQVLEKLCGAGVPFEAVPDLCEMSARRDAKLGELAGNGTLKIAACYPRAVKWLFSAAGAPLPSEGVEILNMRVETAEKVAAALLPGASPAPANFPLRNLPLGTEGEGAVPLGTEGEGTARRESPEDPRR